MVDSLKEALSTYWEGDIIFVKKMLSCLKELGLGKYNIKSLSPLNKEQLKTVQRNI